MIDLGEVGGRFVIVDEASSILGRLIGEFERLDKLINTTKESLSTLRMPPGVTRALTAMNESLTKLPGAAEAAAKGVAVGFDKIDATIKATKIQVGELGAEMRRLDRPNLGSGRPRIGVPGGGAGGGGRGHGGGGFHVGGGPGVHIPGGGHLAADSGSDGFWALVGGVALAEFTKKIVESNMEMQKLATQAKAAGYTSAQQAQIMGAAWGNAGKFVNTTAVESYKNILELTQVTGSLDEAIKMLPSFTSASAALGSLKNDDIKEMVSGKSQTYDFARSLELLGVTTDEKKLGDMTSVMTREMIGMRGLVDGSKMFQGIQNAGGARYAWSSDFVGHALGPLLQASPRAGAGLGQLDRSLAAGVMTEMMAKGAEKYGLFNAKDEFRDAHGRFKGMQPGSIVGYDELRKSPDKWATDIVLPLLKSHGVDINDTNAMSKAILEISRGNKNLNAILDEILLPGPRAQLAKERANIDRVPADASSVLMADDPGLKIAALKDKWADLMNALGGPLTDKAMAGITGLTTALNSMAQFFNAHQGWASIAADGVAVGAGLLVVGGALTMLKFTLSGFSLFGLLGGGKGVPSAPGGPNIPPVVPVSPLGWFKSLIGNVGLPVATLYNQDWIKANLINPILASVFGPPGDPNKPKEMEPWRFQPNSRSTLPYLNAPDLQGIGNEPYRNQAAPKPWPSIDFGAILQNLIIGSAHAETMRQPFIPSPTQAVNSAMKLVNDALALIPPAIEKITRAPPSLGPSSVDLDKAYKAQNGPMGFRAQPEAAHANALSAMKPISSEIQAALTAIPGQVQPAISSAFAQISASISAALAGVAANARMAAAAIPTGGTTHAVTVHTAVNLDGKKFADITEQHIVNKNRTAMSSARFDGGAMPSPTDYAYT